MFTKPHVEWSYDEFLAFLLMFAATDDAPISEEEKEIICNKVGKDCYKRIKKVFLKTSDYEALQIILSFKQNYYKTEHQKKRIFDNINDIFLADEKLSILEENLFREIKRIINL